MKRVLLIGDSIRLNYMPMVCRLLDGKAEVVGPADNCRFAKYTLFYINDWISLFGTPDIIHWNNGLWDVSHSRRETTGCLSSENEYRGDLQRILLEMQKTGAKIIFATSTPIREGNEIFDNEDIVRYNNAALSVMRENGIEINDLYSLVKPNTDSFINDEDLTHLNKEGVKRVGTQVAAVIEKYL